MCQMSRLWEEWKYPPIPDPVHFESGQKVQSSPCLLFICSCLNVLAARSEFSHSLLSSGAEQISKVPEVDNKMKKKNRLNSARIWENSQHQPGNPTSRLWGKSSFWSGVLNVGKPKWIIIAQKQSPENKIRLSSGAERTIKLWIPAGLCILWQISTYAHHPPMNDEDPVGANQWQPWQLVLSCNCCSPMGQSG